MGKDVGGEIERHRGERSELLTTREKRYCVTLWPQGRLGAVFATTIQLWYETCKLFSNIIVRCAFKNARLGAQVQQWKSFLSRKHVLAHLRFAQRYENWTIDDWNCVIISDEKKIDMFNLRWEVMVIDWRWRMPWTSTCPSDHEARWWVGDSLGMHNNF